MASRSSSDLLFLAVAHPARRQILELCLLHEEVPVSLLRERIDASGSSLSQHLKVLKDAALVADRREGRHVFYRITPEPLLEVIRFARDLEAAWQWRLDALGRHLDEAGRAASDAQAPRKRSKRA